MRHSDDTVVRAEKTKEESKDALLKTGPDVAGQYPKARSRLSAPHTPAFSGG